MAGITRPLASLIVTGLLLCSAPGYSPARAEPPRRFDDEKIVSVQVKTRAQLGALEASGAIILNCIPGVGPMDVLVTPAELAWIEQSGLSTRVVLENVQAWVDAQRAVAGVADPFADFFLDYHPYGDAGTSGSIVWYLNQLVMQHPTLASLVSVGTTLQGRTIWGLRITGAAIVDRPAVVYFGCEHAREWITSTTPSYVATHLLENYGTDTLVTELVDNVEFFLIPVLNVDGYRYTWTADRFWRKNRRNNGDGTVGVDLNRNWAEGWGGAGSSGSTGSETYRGLIPFSEPETQVLRDFFLDHPNVRAQLDIHSYSHLILWPYGYTSTLPPDQDVYETVGTAMQSLIYDVHGLTYDAGPVYTTIYPASGVSIDWTYGQLDILSFSYELRPATSGAGGFDLPPDQIIPNNEEILPAVLRLTDSDWVREAIRFRFPEGVPTTVAAGADTVILVDLIGQREFVVPETASLFYRYDSSGPFIEFPLTPMGGDAYAAVLPATNCTSTPEFYFRVTGDGGTTLTSPENAPIEAIYSAVVTAGSQPHFTEDLDGDPGWATEGQWAWGEPQGLGGEYGPPDPTSGYTGGNVYGYNLYGDYTNGIPPYHLTSPPMDCTGRYALHLTFWRWLGVEMPAYDQASVSVSNNGTDWVTVWQNTSDVGDTSWTPQDLDISAVADNQPTVYLRWTMGPTDGILRFCGWNIDDIQLQAALCEPTEGDYNGDGAVDDDDYAQFESCYSDTSGSPGPGCGIFDFDSDGDVDCDDWSAFRSAWTGPGEPPIYEPCDAHRPPTAGPSVKNRYITFVPGASLGLPQAFRVTTVSSPLFPGTVGDAKWVGTPGADGISRLQCTPSFVLWDGEDVHVADRDIVPGASYAVETTLDGVEFLGPLAIETVPVWGDVVGVFEDGAWTGPNNVVDILDATALVDAFKHLASAPPQTWSDLHPAVPDGVIHILDIIRVVDTFHADDYPFPAPQPCDSN